MEQPDYIIEYIRTNQEQLVKEWKDKLVSLGEEKTDQYYTSFCNEYINILLAHSMNDEEGKIAVFAQRLVEFGWTLTSIIDSVSEFGKIIFFHITGNASEKKQVEFVWGYDQRISPINNRLFNQYASSWQKMVSQQKIALQELSAPLIPVFDNISVMPLVGTIDTERAKKIMENLLEGVVKFRSQVVLIDITGVPVVDTMVAHHIIQASEAVRLVGAQCIIVGIRAEIAQTIVTLGINLDQVMTKSSLQKGILAALKMTNRKIVTMED